MSTAELDEAAERFIRARGATPTFKGYRGFPASICASPNSMVVHGIPGPERLKSADIISIDVGVTLDGWVADAARTFPVERSARRLRTCSRRPRPRFSRAWPSASAGNRMGDVSGAIQRVAEEAGLSVVRSLVGHGVGRSMHEDPQVPNYGKPGKGPLLEEGMVLAIEPMMTAGRAGRSRRRRRLGDLLDDGSPAAHFEFTVAVTAEGPRILTPWHLADDDAAPSDRTAGGVDGRLRRRAGRLSATGQARANLLPSGVLLGCEAVFAHESISSTW